MSVAALAADRYGRRARPEESRRWQNPGELAAAINPRTVQTPALDLIDQVIVAAFRTSNSRTIITMPPQEGKSERVTKTGTLWGLIDNPDRRFAIASYAQTLAEGFGRDVRNWVAVHDGTEGTLDLGLRIARDNGAARRWQLAGRRGGVVAVGIGSGLTGRPVDALIIDDPFKDAAQAESLYYRERVWNWWLSVASTRLAPGAPVVLIMTRWHEDDLAGRLLAGDDRHRWRLVNIPALADHDPAKGQADPLGRAPGEWLQSARTDEATGERRTVAQWEAIRTQVGTRVFTSLYQGRPSPDTGNVWRRGWWRRYSRLLWQQHPDAPNALFVPDADEVILSWDMAFKDTKGSDFVAGGVWARFGADVYLLDQVHRRMSFTDTVAAFKAQVARWPQASAKLVEDKANGTAVIDQLRRSIPGIVPVTPHESKYARAQAVAPFIEAGNVWLPEGDAVLPGVDPDGVIDEAAAFPNGQHDDQVDQTSQALARLLLRAGQGQVWMQWMKNRNRGPDDEGGAGT